MTTHQSDWAKGIKASPYPHFAGELVALRATFAFTAAHNVLNDVIEMIELPANNVPFDVILDCDDLDSGTTLVFDVGIMSGAVGDADSVRTCGDELLDGVTTGQAGGVVRPTLAKAFRIAPSANARSIGIKIAAAATTPASGTIGLSVSFREP